tara:strand:- start:1317 stop:2165 length:849 start_codon:yes stop_codon:yes gene_type:complete
MGFPAICLNPEFIAANSTFTETFNHHSGIPIALPSLKTSERSQCPFCRSKDIEPEKDKKFTAWDKFIRSWGTTYSHCSDCESFFVTKAPTEEWMDIIYESVYPEVTSKQFGGLSRFRKHFGNDIIFDENVLEIGGGSGGVQNICRKQYFNLDPQDSANAPRVTSPNVERLTESDIKDLSEINFGSVIACDIIEHLLEPSSIFSTSSSILRKGGRLFVNFGEYITLKHYNSRNEAIKAQTLHINIATDRTIACLAKKFNFDLTWAEEVKETARSRAFVFEKSV